jgi:hypothetical protein
VSQLLPADVDGLADCPYTIHDAILKALHWLGYEDLDLADRPPKKLWLDGEAMEEWWRERSRIQREKYGLDPDDIEGPTMKNDAAKGLIDFDG